MIKTKVMIEACPGCGAAFPHADGPVHRYMTSSPACWRHFGALLAYEYTRPELGTIHRLSVDAYAVQHPGDGSRQAIQSVGLHLARLMILLDRPLSPEKANTLMQRLAERKTSLMYLEPPVRFSMTIADVAPFAGTDHHAKRVKRWARSAFEDWEAHRAAIKAFAEAG